MPGLVIHAIAPTLVMLAMRRYYDPRLVLLLWPMTLVPDIDYFVGIHRATTANLFFVGGVLLTTYGLARVFDKPRAHQWGLITATYLGSHLLMDMLTGGIVPFYPLSTYTVCWFFYVEAKTATNDVTTYFEPCSHEGAPVVSAVYPVLDTDQAAMLVFVAVAWGGYVLTRAVHAYRARPSR